MNPPLLSQKWIPSHIKIWFIHSACNFFQWLFLHSLFYPIPHLLLCLVLLSTSFALLLSLENSAVKGRSEAFDCCHLYIGLGKGDAWMEIWNFKPLICPLCFNSYLYKLIISQAFFTAKSTHDIHQDSLMHMDFRLKLFDIPSTTPPSLYLLKHVNKPLPSRLYFFLFLYWWFVDIICQKDKGTYSFCHFFHCLSNFWVKEIKCL